MKTKDVVYMLLAALIFLVAGYIAYTQFMAPQKSTSQEVKVEVVGEIEPDFDQSSLAKMQDISKVRDFGVAIDLNSGLNNGTLFGP